MKAISSKRVSDCCCGNRKSASGSADQKQPRRPRWLGLLATVVTFALGVTVAAAQQPTQIPRIATLSVNPVSLTEERLETLRHGLREHGYVEGKNIAIDSRAVEGKLDRLPAIAVELVRLKVNVLVSLGPAPTRALKAATTTIPIVMTNDPDPVADGIVASLAHPGGNITGLSTLAPELSGKRLELLKEVVPKLSRVAVLGTSTIPGYGQVSKEVELAAKALKLELEHLDILQSKDVETAFRTATKVRADAVLTLNSGIISSVRHRIAELAAKNRLPVMYHSEGFVEAGGLMFYGVNRLDLDRRAAAYIDKILKGRKPADLPVEQPVKFEFIVNLKAAKQIGLTVPPNVLVRADKVIR